MRIMEGTSANVMGKLDFMKNLVLILALTFVARL